MKTILIPTDFSEDARNALRFAISTAHEAKAKLILLNVYEVPAPVAEVPFDVLKQEQLEIKKSAEIKLRGECQKIKEAGGIEFEYHAVKGDTVHAILDYSKSRHIDYIILGTKGTGRREGIFGSTTSRLMTKTNVPVIAIPQSARFRDKISKIAFATNYEVTDIDAIVKLSELASSFNAEINVLHVCEPETANNDQNELMNDFRRKVHTATNYPRISFGLICGDDTIQQLKDYISNNKADIVVMSTHLRSALQRIFERSLTKQMILATDIPLIVYHHTKEKILT